MSTTLTISRARRPRTAPAPSCSGLDLVVASGGVTALVGANGSGKSSLMRTIVGELPVESGSIRLSPPDATIGWLPQAPPDPDESLLGYARRRTGVADADQALHDASAALAAGEAGRRRPLRRRPWSTGSRSAAPTSRTGCRRSPAQLGLDARPDRPLGTLSGGQAARAALASILLSRYEVLLLDEPTNNLDAPGLALMVDFVTGHEGPVMVASHDRDFLDRVATDVVELDLAQQRIGHYSGACSRTSSRPARSSAGRRARPSRSTPGPGTGSSPRAGSAPTGPRRDAATSSAATRPDKHIREKHQARADRQAAKAARLQRSADRLDGGAPAAQGVGAALRHRPRRRVGRGGVDAGPAWCVRRDEFELGPIDLTVSRGDRLLLAGDNGTGKTTLLAAMLGDAAAGVGPGLRSAHACGSA